MDQAKNNCGSIIQDTLVMSHPGFTEVLKRDKTGKRRLAIVSHAADPDRRRARMLANEILSAASTLDRSPGAYLRLEVLDAKFLRLTLSASHSHASAVLTRSASDENLKMACRQIILTDAGRLEEALSVAADRLAVK